MNKGLIELLRQSQALLDHGDTEGLMNSSIWDAALRDITRLIVDLRGNNHADIAFQLQSDLDRLESGVEDGVAGKPEFRASAKYRRWSALRRLMSDVEGIARLAKRSPAFLDDRSPNLNWLVGATQNASDNSLGAPSSATETPAIRHDDRIHQFGGPEPDPSDDRIAWWLGKRIYLGSNTQLGRLFWLLARPVGAVRQLAEVQRAVDGFETNSDYVSDPKEINRASARVRKTFSRLRERLRKAELDIHVAIVRDGGNEAPTYSMVMRHNG